MHLIVMDGNLFNISKQNNLKQRVYQTAKFPTVQLGFSQTHKIGNIGIKANFVFRHINLKFSSLFVSDGVRKCENKYQWV